MPHVDILFSQLQQRKTEPAQVKTAIDNFEKCIVDVRNEIDDKINEAKRICTEPQGNKRRRRNNSNHDHRVAALEVCDNIVNSANDRFQFKDHLVAASLFFPNTLENTVIPFSEPAAPKYGKGKPKQQEVKILLINVRSLRRKIDELEAFLVDEDIDVPCLTEHWLTKEEMEVVHLQGYMMRGSSERKDFTDLLQGILIPSWNQWREY
ncbi:unnamed protein product [Acanthoscelides obtectus]|uniref:Uncharacterized protein n=1 Tax=Acanthoscelides obtectus TaxID=200917 RepID=A0A9P0LTL9_ACAOB|nr:unnamed protein product [Acanthoscelides obtectus]CAK1643631.1 hypothetical protein AOBTE_LOCUS13612 [Acanthoscelides obtectus]